MLSTDSISGYVFKLTINNIENSPYYKFRGLETLDSETQLPEKVGTILVKAMLTHTGDGVFRVLGRRKEVADANTFNEEVNAQQELAFSTPGLFEPITPTVLFSKFDCNTAPQSLGNKILRILGNAANWLGQQSCTVIPGDHGRRREHSEGDRLQGDQHEHLDDHD